MVKTLRIHGFPHAERRALAGCQDLGDITGCPGIVFEVKGGDAARNASDAQIAAWMVETEVERVNARAEVGVLVVQRRGVGAQNAHRWWAHITSRTLTALMEPSIALFDEAPDVPVRLLLGDVTQLLRWAGYGTPLEAEAVAS
ncbi:hypothetical protein [Nonomuraea sp. SYSU D8015]|uniref:hypothetical protein n=1 Tax=Nonomuraea sp. SYSU D8015 TaxID=2593644 RepID=UPI001660F1D7|nr:hypothetical protein [Nonomuraea sp. SYSU D8015]